MEDVIYYELFIKNVTSGSNYFSFFSRINTTYYSYYNYYSFIVNEIKINSEYHFMYRAVNNMGEGPNSTILIV